MNERKAKIIVLSLIILSVVSCLVIGGVSKFIGTASFSSFIRVWPIVYFVLFWHWIYYESASQEKFDRPYNFGLSIQSFWHLYIPWYFVRTRGVKGIAYIVGFLLLFLAPVVCVDLS